MAWNDFVGAPGRWTTRLNGLVRCSPIRKLQLGEAVGSTIKPAPYPAGPNLMRPAHIRFQVTGRQDRLVTQIERILPNASEAECGSDGAARPGRVALCSPSTYDAAWQLAYSPSTVFSSGSVV